MAMDEDLKAKTHREIIMTKKSSREDNFRSFFDGNKKDSPNRN
jgi:hypothetical protein